MDGQCDTLCKSLSSWKIEPRSIQPLCPSQELIVGNALISFECSRGIQAKCTETHKWPCNKPHCNAVAHVINTSTTEAILLRLMEKILGTFAYVTAIFSWDRRTVALVICVKKGQMGPNLGSFPTGHSS